MELYTAVAVDVWKGLTGGDIPEGDGLPVQRAWDNVVIKTNREKLWNMGQRSVNQRARLLACFPTESGAWINAVPLVSLGTLLTSAQFWLAVAVRLGIPVCNIHR